MRQPDRVLVVEICWEERRGFSRATNMKKNKKCAGLGGVLVIPCLRAGQLNRDGEPRLQYLLPALRVSCEAFRTSTGRFRWSVGSC